MNLLNKILAIGGVICITCLVAVSQDNRTISVQPIINAASLGQATNVFIGSSTGVGITTNTAGSVYTPFLYQTLTDYNGNSWTNVGFQWQQSSGGSQSPLQPLIGDPLFVSPYRIHVTDHITSTNMLTIRNLYLGWTSDARIDGYVSAGGVGFYGGGLNITNVAASNVVAGGTLSATIMPAHTGDVTSPAGSIVNTLAAGSASVLNSGTLNAGRLPALTGDVTSSAGSAATTLAAGSATVLNSGTLNAARMPALTGDITTSAGAVATTLKTSPTIVTPTIASFVNATHNHQNAAGGGALDAAAVTSGTFAIGRLATGTPDGTKFVRDDGTLVTPSTGSTSVYSNQTITIAGTANQITSSAGAQNLSANRTWTLSTPQDIATTSTPQFARMGLGVAADGTIPFNIWSTIATGTSTAAIAMTNTTVATLNNQAQSPWFEQDGNGWKTTATAGSQPIGTRFGAIPIQGATSPSVYWRLQTMTNNAAYKTVVDFSADAGQTNTGQYISFGGGMLLTGPAGTSVGKIISGANQLLISGATTTSLGLNGVSAIDIISGEVQPQSESYDLGDSSSRWRSFWILNQVRKTADTTTTSASLATTSLSAANLTGSRIYGLHIVLYFNNTIAADGLSFDFGGGSATATGFRCGIVISDTTGVVKTAQTSALATATSVATITGDTMAVCDAMIEVNSGGTFIPRFAVNSHTTGTLTCYKYSYIVPSNFP